MQEVKSMHEASSVRYRFHLVLLATLLLIFFWSAIEPADRFTWVLEVLPAVLGVLALMATFRRFPLTGLLTTGCGRSTWPR
jgi:putative membrane protein